MTAAVYERPWRERRRFGHPLVQTRRMLMDPELAAEGFTRITCEIAETKGGVSKLTVTHELEGKPRLQVLMSGGLEDQGAGGGWAWVLSELKTLPESGSPMVPPPPRVRGRFEVCVGGCLAR